MKLLLGDCLDKLKELEDNSVDSIVTDPPYGLSAAKNSGKSSKGGFIGKKWDYDVPSTEVWEECMRVLKPGGHLLSFAGSRTYHRMTVRIEDAGFEIRDQIMWIYGSGFPKSHDVGKNIEKRKVGGIKNLKQIGTKQGIKVETGTQGFSYNKEYVPGVSMGGKQISGEIPIYEITNEYKGWGTALKPAHEPIVMARKPLTGKSVADNVIEWGTGGINIDESRIENTDTIDRFPANILFDEEAGKLLDEQYAGVSRFFYCPKTSKAERNEGTDNNHPTVKPTDLMLYLIRLVTPKGGVTLDPFMGSGSTGKAAIIGGFDFIGIEREEEYFQIAESRINYEIIKPSKTTKSKVSKKVEEKVNQFFG